jgi:hypothetical protein
MILVRRTRGEDVDEVEEPDDEYDELESTLGMTRDKSEIRSDHYRQFRRSAKECETMTTSIVGHRHACYQMRDEKRVCTLMYRCVSNADMIMRTSR